MIRAFVAIPMPEPAQTALGRLQAALPLPRPAAPEGLHLTLAFLGDLAEPAVEEAHLALSAIRAPRFPLTLEGAGLFGGAKPHTAWAGTAPSPALAAPGPGSRPRCAAPA